MDVSASMAAEDIPPSRLEAAQDAAKKFVSGLPPNVRVGIVSYARTAHVVQAPTIDRIAVRTTIDELVLQPGTAIGSGLVVALATAFPELHIDTMESPVGKDAAAQAMVRRLEFASPVENARTPPAIVGEYYAATSGEDLRSVYAQLADRIAIEVVQTELGALFSLAAAILLVCGSSFALRDTSRII